MVLELVINLIFGKRFWMKHFNWEIRPRRSFLLQFFQHGHVYLVCQPLKSTLFKLFLYSLERRNNLSVEILSLHKGRKLRLFCKLWRNNYWSGLLIMVLQCLCGEIITDLACWSWCYNVYLTVYVVLVLFSDVLNVM